MPEQPWLQPEGPQRNVPEVKFPTPNIEDLVIIEDVPVQQGGIGPVLYGFPHPKRPSARLVFQGPHKAGAGHVVTRRIYATSRSAQDAYNLSMKYVHESHTHPIFIRTYLQLRTNYTATVEGTPLQTLVGLKIVTPGAGYTTPPKLEIDASASTEPATGITEVFNGQVVTVLLTSGGEGFPFEPTVTVTGGEPSIAAVIGAVVQPSGAILVHEEMKPAEGELASLFVWVTRVWKTLPGPELRGEVIDKRTGLLLTTTKQDVLAGTHLRTNADGSPLPPEQLVGMMSGEVDPVDVVQSVKTTSRYLDAVTGLPTSVPLTTVDKEWNDEIQGSIWEQEAETPIGAAEPEVGSFIGSPPPGRVIIDYKIRPLNGTSNITTYWTVAYPIGDWAEYPDQGEQFPALFDFLIEGAVVASVSDLNRPGVVYNYLAHRTDSYTQQLIHAFINFIPDLRTLPPVWHVRSPASGSRVFPISANTIHPAFSIYDSKGALEIFPASSPANYYDTLVLFRGCDVKLWRGKMYHLQFRFSCERGFDTNTGTKRENLRSTALAEAAAGGIKKLSAKSRLVYDGALGAQFTVCGTADGESVVETAQITTTGPRRGEARFNLIESIQFAFVSGFNHSVVRATGTKDELRFDFGDGSSTNLNPVPNATWTWEVVGAHYTPAPYGYTFKTMQDRVRVGGTLGNAPTIDGEACFGDFLWDGTTMVNGQKKYVRGLFDLTWDGTSKWLLQRVPPTGAGTPPANHWFRTSAAINGSYTASGTAANGPLSAGIPTTAYAGPLLPGEVKLGATVEETRDNLVAAMNLVTPIGGIYGAGTTQTLHNPFFSDDPATAHETLPHRLLMTDKVAMEHSLTYLGTAAGVVTVTQQASNGAMVAQSPVAALHYNRSELWNPEFKLNVPPGLVDAPCEEIVLLYDPTTLTDMAIRYRMQAEITVKYRLWNAGTSSYDPATEVELPTVTGDDVAEYPIASVGKILFLVSNSHATEAKRLHLYLHFWTP
jgi:hypothetical protein